MLRALFRTLSQLDDPTMLGVLLRSIAWSVAAFAALVAACSAGIHALVGDPGWIGWTAATLGGLGATLLAVWLFVPATVVIATFYSDRIAAAVERRWYPGLPPATPAPLAPQLWDGLALGAQVLALQAVTLVLALLLPGLGIVLGWAITGWALGRGLFVAVAMRRTGRRDAIALYAAHRLPVLALGGLFAAAATVPPLNLLVPVLAIAALTHVLHQSATPALLPPTPLRGRPARIEARPGVVPPPAP